MPSLLRFPVGQAVFQLPERLTEVNSWHGHIPFAFWIVEALEPSVFVELGVHRGDSYFAFCQAVKSLGLDTRCYGVDTWKGDAHAGFYGEEIYEDFSAYNREHYQDFSKPLRTTFAEAIEQFEDGSIDLLHVDGYHTYEAVRSDFGCWLPKLSERAVVLFHDIAVTDRGFGVWRFWEEIAAQYPSFGFMHSFGLGVLGVGKELPDSLASFFEDAKANPEILHSFYEALGTRCQLFGDLQRARDELANTTAAPAISEEVATLRQQVLDLTYRYERALERKEAEAEQLEAKVVDLEARLGQSSHSAAALAEHLASVTAQRDEILQSETWKLTAPARGFLWWMRRVANWRRFTQTFRVTLQPLQGVGESLFETDSFVALGGRMRFAIEGAPRPPGWYELTCTVTTTSDLSKMRPYIITETQDHQRYSQQIPGKVDPEGQIRVLFHVNKQAARHELLLVGLNGITSISAPRVKPALHLGEPMARILAAAIVPTIAYADLPPIAAHQELLPQEDEFSRWIERNERINQDDRERVARELATWEHPPLISVLMPVYNTPIRHLVTAIESVRAQWYPHWELCIADDASTDPEIRPILTRYQEADPRIKVAFRDENGGISANSNTALTLANGKFVAYLDADDEISEVALLHYAREIHEYPGVELLFCDEDKITEDGDRSDPYFKPSLSPALLLGKNCVTHLGVYRTDTVRRLGGMRSEFDGSQDWDLALRFLPIVGIDFTRARRIPRLLYHWRRIHGSTATTLRSKSWAVLAGRHAVQDYLDTAVPGAKAEPIPRASNLNRLVLPTPDPAPLVSILLPTAGNYQLLRGCLSSLLERTDYPRFEVLITIDSDNPDADSLAYLDTLEHTGKVRVIRRRRPPGETFNYSRIVNNLARYAAADLLLLLNDDTEVINAGWLTEMVAVLSLPDVGVVGAHLYYADGSIQHAGVMTGHHRALHLYSGLPGASWGYYADLLLARNVSAVTGACLLTSRRVWDEVGGLDEQLAVSFNDVAYCRAAGALGYQIIVTPHARLKHFESVTRGFDDLTLPRRSRLASEFQRLATLFPDIAAADPFYNPNLVPEGQFRLQYESPIPVV
ncbi:glycosyl transferase family 2 [Acidimicrobium ferrooxidans DSM 10331]|uniref:Glycosyl transferase family 2 n=1 Tax=Acidimicrobium ferrooxidans (strain DSM 10331 / JCM 15462 / NBRC 103882 / ICP) TaxID=525909 RepID=C7M1X8_ACIFD|nr:glycosyltransferase [Acidimicrobium ferrooxidans]ACU54875.1 glycosyl transferase family 2 [Acidimicrobium ferrooxidans DSM 10331]